jgi:hypothetical protein
MVKSKPHIFTHIPVRNSSTGGRVDVPTEQTPRNIRCQITPMTAESAIKTFGDIEVRRPHLMICEVEDGETIRKGDDGVFDGEEFFVKEAPMHFKAGRSTNHSQVLLDQKQYP